MSLKKILIVTVVTTLLLGINTPAQNKDNDDSVQTKSALTSEEAVAKAIDYLGIQNLKDFNIDKALTKSECVILHDSTTPFLSETINNDTVWEVVFDIDFGLIDEELSKGMEYYKTVHTYLDKNKGTLIKIVAVEDGVSESALPILPPADIAENGIRAVGDGQYHGIPGDVPKTSFFEAMKEVIVDYRDAVEITALYVLFSDVRVEEKPVWDIHIYGIEHPLGAGRKNIPLNQRNHLRNVIDAITGKGIFATGPPHPLEKL
ncbi:MAG: hypothetical protein ACOYVF_06175 [Candidatus Zixiibacteriota bacterium]